MWAKNHFPGSLYVEHLQPMFSCLLFHSYNMVIGCWHLPVSNSPEEAARYLETYKIFENKPPEAIMEKTEENFMAKVCISSVYLFSLCIFLKKSGELLAFFVC